MCPILSSVGLDDSIQNQTSRINLLATALLEHCITTELDYSNHIDYIVFNPVKHGLVIDVRDWPYSTFHRDVARGIYPPEWAGTPGGIALAGGGEPV